MFNSPQSPLAASGNPNIAAQIHQYQQRQEHLMASTQRRIQQEAEARRHSRGAENASATLQPPHNHSDTYHQHHASLPLNFGSSGYPSAAFSANPRLSVQQELAPGSGPAHPYRYMNDESLAQISYSPSVANDAFSVTRPLELRSRTTNSASVEIADPEIAKHAQLDETAADLSHLKGEVITPSPPVKRRASSDSEARLTDDDEFVARVVEEPHIQPLSIRPSEIVAETEAEDPFHAFDRAFEPWESGDNEWLYSLQTECARPGAVCECGDSCCCPGCFTHTNNPGDRGLYDTMLNKLGAILGPEEEASEKDKENCQSTSPATNDAKL
jgi:hypothetical protein